METIDVNGQVYFPVMFMLIIVLGVSIVVFYMIQEIRLRWFDGKVRDKGGKNQDVPEGQDTAVKGIYEGRA